MLKGLIVCVALLLASAGHTAPAPVHKPPPPYHLDGCWDMTWRENKSSVWLSRNGFFADYYNGGQWLGTWSLEGNVLTVTEKALATGSEITWAAKLDPPQRDKPGYTGALTYGGNFRLDR